MSTRALKSRRRRRSPDAGRGARLGAVSALLGLLTVVLLALAAVILRLTAQLPDVGQVEALFGLRGAEQYRPMLVFDRTGEALLYRHLNPDAETAVWLELGDMPEFVVEAAIAAAEPEFWANPGTGALASLDPDTNTIAERVVKAMLLPPIDNPFMQELSSALLATELASRYSKERILLWYLNSSDFGRAAFGIDAAALAYFDKHAGELELDEASLLAALAADPGLDVSSGAPGARGQVLAAMPSVGSNQAERAAQSRLNLQPDAYLRERPDFAGYLLAQLERTIGRAAVGRSGLRVVSTLDQDLQDQAACAAASHVERLSGESIESTVAARGQRPCVSAALLPTLRPGDAGISHQIDDWGLVILDPTNGELLAAHGEIDARHSAGPAVEPFVYLTAFARGSGPASMLLDLGPDLALAQGPVRMRTALANLYPGAANRLLDTVGSDAVLRTMAQMGLSQEAEAGETASLIDLTGAYGIFASGGLRAGAAPSGEPPQPSMLLQVREADGTLLYRYEPANQAILSPQLSYLMVDVLSDEPARWPSLGQGNLLELGFPTGVLSGVSDGDESDWTIGFSSQRVVGVWLGGSPLRQVGRLNGAASIWHAAMRFASANLNARGWERPPGVSEIEVCEPSGLLPTSYCPSTVRELFAAGTEPTNFDNLYQPVRVNRETGKLATLFTPLESVEERVYFVPPPAAAEWAKSVGLDLPPDEYDPLSAEGPSFPDVLIGSPDPFDIVGDQVAILGEAAPEDFEYYRLQYGQGLNPAHWVQIGSDRARPVSSGRLGSWSTEGLNGLYTLQLLVILADGQVRTAAVPLTIDNEAPQVRLVSPEPGESISLRRQPTLTLQGEVLDDVAVQRVEFVVDGRRVATLFQSPYSYSWRPGRSGEYELSIRAYDAAGNRADSPPVMVGVVP